MTLVFIGLRLAESAARVMPRWLALLLATGLARAAFALRVPARARLLDNLRRSLQAASRHELESKGREAFEHFALSLVDSFRLGRLSPDQVAREVEVHGRAHLDGARACGRGVILLSVHAGNWEWGAAFLSAVGARLHIAAREQPGTALESWFSRLRARHQVTRLPGRPIWPAAAQALRRNEWVAVMGDRVPPGERVSVCAWAAALARRTGAVILPALILRRPGGGYVAWFEAPLSPHECLAGGFRAALKPHLEHHPGQWLAFEPLPEGLA